MVSSPHPTVQSCPASGKKPTINTYMHAYTYTYLYIHVSYLSIHLFMFTNIHYTSVTSTNTEPKYSPCNPKGAGREGTAASLWDAVQERSLTAAGETLKVASSLSVAVDLEATPLKQS